MATVSTIRQTRANPTTETSFGNRRRALRLNAAVMQKSRDLFPVKTAQYLADLTGYSVRSCEGWLSENRVLPADALASLIQSHRGREYLAAVMVDATPRWWIAIKAWWSSVDVATAKIKYRRKLRELLEDEAYARAPQDSAAFLLQDEDFYSGQPAPRSRLAPTRKGR